jgi:hydroxymethylbilane synthase
MPVQAKEVKWLPTLKIGTRDSVLAQWQTQWVLNELKRFWPQLDYQVLAIKTTGDKILDVSLSKIGDKGLFTKELEVYLQNREIDIAVHSLKDLPTQLPAGCTLGAICKRAEPGDVLISQSGATLAELPGGSRIGTSSLRRKAQLLHFRPDLQIEDLRGNVLTRLKKLEQQGLAAIILAAAGVKRLGLAARITEYLPYEVCLPAVGQGAIALEIREDDPETWRLIQPIHDAATAAATLAERALLRRLEGGCQIPIAALAQINLSGSELVLEARVASEDGLKLVPGKRSIPWPVQSEIKPKHYDQINQTDRIEQINQTNETAQTATANLANGSQWPYQPAVEKLGRELAEELLARGAGDILKCLGR